MIRSASALIFGYAMLLAAAAMLLQSGAARPLAA